MIKGEVFSKSEDEEYFFDEGCFILEMMNSPADDEVSIARARVEVGKTTRFHRLEGVTERYVILQGQGVVSLGTEEDRPVKPGDVVLIPGGVAQKITNSGEDDLVFLAICSPRFKPDCYQDLED